MVTVATGVSCHRGLTVEVAFEGVCRILRYGSERMAARTREALEEIGDEARSLLEPACCFTLLDRDELGGSKFLRGIPAVGICLVTIGASLERRVADWREAGQVARALLLDAWGSAAVEATADRAEELMSSEVDDPSLSMSRRFSPGYGGWSVAEQGWVLAAVESGRLGVTATRGWMMYPRKSTTFAVTVGHRPIELRCDGDCDECTIPGCEMRRPPPGTRRESWR